MISQLENRLKADKELVKEVYSAAKRFKMERVKQVHVAPSSFTARTTLFIQTIK